MIINIWNRWDKIVTYLKTITALNIFTGWIYFWKTIVKPTNWMYLYFTLENNSPKISSDNYWVYAKTWLFNFCIVWNDKAKPDVELFEALDILSNNIRTFWKDRINLDWFEIMNIEEWNQSWVLRDKNENPYIIWQYEMIYKYLYL